MTDMGAWHEAQVLDRLQCWLHHRNAKEHMRVLRKACHRNMVITNIVYETFPRTWRMGPSATVCHVCKFVDI
jgi:hypothetical protein